MHFLVKLRSFSCKFSRAYCNSCFFLILLQHKPGFALVGRDMIGNVNFAAMLKWPCVRGAHESLENFLKISCKVTIGFFQITRKVKAVI